VTVGQQVGEVVVVEAGDGQGLRASGSTWRPSRQGSDAGFQAARWTATRAGNSSARTARMV
jgi:hypothetical protein